MSKEVFLKATLGENVNQIFRLKNKLFHIIHRDNNLKNTPVIINNYNRLEYLQMQIDWLSSLGLKNIFIIDNASTFEPLLLFYKTCNYPVYRLDKNVGHEAIWRTHVYQRFMKQFYIYTDPDVLPADETPSDFLNYFYSLLKKYTIFNKIGFGLKTDDLPDHYSKKGDVIKWESQFYAEELEPGVYKAPIDTTFALYRPGSSFQCWQSTLRTGTPYVLKHMPWYENDQKLSGESLFYSNNITEVSSWYKASAGESSIYDK